MSTHFTHMQKDTQWVCYKLSTCIACSCVNVLMFHVQSSIELLYIINHFLFHFRNSKRSMTYSNADHSNDRLRKTSRLFQY